MAVAGVLENQPAERGGAKKLSNLLRQLEEEAYQQFLCPEYPAPFSLPVFDEIAAMWRDWQHGIPPGREWRGRGAQNPRLLEAFAALERAEWGAQRQRAKRQRDLFQDPEIMRLQGQ